MLATRAKRFWSAVYVPPEPDEPEPWNGGVELGCEGAGPALDGAAGAGDAGLGGAWVVGAAGAAGRGVTGGAAVCTDVDECPGDVDAGGAAETGRGGGGGGTKGFGAGAGDAATGLGGGGAAGFGGGGGAVGLGAGAAAIGFGGGGITGFTAATVAAAGCLGAVF